MVFNLNQQTLFLIFAVLVIWLVIISLFLLRLIKHYNRLISGTDKKTLSQVLEKILKNLEISDQKIGELTKRAQKQEEEGLTHIQKIALLRFNPFEEVGGDQSFVLALLDGNNSGMVITSLYSRSGTRWYGKTVKNGKSTEYEFSKEEKEVIKKAEGVNF